MLQQASCDVEISIGFERQAPIYFKVKVGEFCLCGDCIDDYQEVL